MRQPLAVLALCSLAVPAAGSARSFIAELPPTIRAAHLDSVRSCTRLGGTLTVLRRPSYIRRADLNGDGRFDYLLDQHALNCRGVESIFCGSAGCGLSLHVSGPGGSYRRADPWLTVRASRIVHDRGRALLHFPTRDGRHETIWGWTGQRLEIVRANVPMPRRMQRICTAVANRIICRRPRRGE